MWKTLEPPGACLQIRESSSSGSLWGWRWHWWCWRFVAGAVGNGIDRFTMGYVVDFFNFVWIRFPVFNVADVAINIGVACLLIGLLRGDSNKTEPTPALPSPQEKSGRDGTH
jgi:hypothetical protein